MHKLRIHEHTCTPCGECIGKYVRWCQKHLYSAYTYTCTGAQDTVTPTTQSVWWWFIHSHMHTDLIVQQLLCYEYPLRTIKKPSKFTPAHDAAVELILQRNLFWLWYFGHSFWAFLFPTRGCWWFRLKETKRQPWRRVAQPSFEDCGFVRDRYESVVSRERLNACIYLKVRLIYFVLGLNVGSQ